jgi:cobalt-zinc-cadmium efflux system protein
MNTDNHDAPPACNTHPHSHAEESPSRYKVAAKRRIAAGAAVTVGMMVIEVVGGLVSGSLALLSDAGHMLTHFIALVVALVAIMVAARPAPKEYTYGYFRAEILGGFFNAFFVFLVGAYLAFEAVRRLFSPVPIEVAEMLFISLLGLAANIVTAVLLRGASHEDLNVRGAFIHVLSDTVSSVAVIAAAIVIALTGLITVDTVASFLIAGLVFVWGANLLRGTAAVLLESAPGHIKLDALVRDLLAQFPTLSDVHDLHVWTLTSGSYCLSAHLLTCEDCAVSQTQKLIAEVNRFLDTRYGIRHTTFQVECGLQKTRDRLRRGVRP